MNIIESILTKNPCYTAGRKITVKGLMLHSVGCPQPNASVFVKNWNSASYDRACVHGFIDAKTGDVHQTLPWNYRGWHGGGSSNNTHIGVEMCEPDCIKYTGGSSFTCSDPARAKEMVSRTYNSAVELFAFLCKKFNLDPMKNGVIISHKEGHKLGVASNHGDPEHLWSQLGLPYTMDTFRQAVRDCMTGETKEDVTAPTPSESNTQTLYRVQVGAFSVKANAERLLNDLKSKGYDGFIVTVNKTTEKKSVEDVAREVIKGLWGNGQDRVNRLTEAGYDYSEVQKMVNELLGK